jgi:Flp pilus assembly protein TadD
MSTPAHPLQARYFEQRSRGELAAATETLKTVLKGDPRADWAYNELIELFYASGRHGDALTLARTALRVNPLNAQGHNLFGTILSQLNDLPAGEWHFRRALHLGGEQAPFLANLALNLM